MRAWPAGAALLLLLVAAEAAVQVQQDISVAPTATVPVTLASATSGTTTVGASLTSASTSGAVLPGLGSASTLRILHGSQDWTARLEVVSASGFGLTDSVTVSLVGATTQVQVRVSLGSLAQSTGTAVSLPAAGPDITVVAAGGVVGTATLTMRIVLVPASAPQPVLAYTYTLGLT